MDLTKKKNMDQSQTQAEWVARRLAEPPPHPPNPRHPRRTNKAIQKTPRERENSAASPSPTTATFQSIRLRRNANAKHTTRLKSNRRHDTRRRRNSKNGRNAAGTAGIQAPRGGALASRPERNRSSMRRRRPRGTQRRRWQRE